jgi:hypothetical protein
MRYFYNLHIVLESPSAVYYNKSKSGKTGVLDCDIILYKIIDNQYIHVGLDEDIGVDKERGKYVAKTFLIDPNPVFIDGQVVIEIEKSEKERHRRTK